MDSCNMDNFVETHTHTLSLVMDSPAPFHNSSTVCHCLLVAAVGNLHLFYILVKFDIKIKIDGENVWNFTIHIFKAVFSKQVFFSEISASAALTDTKLSSFILLYPEGFLKTGEMLFSDWFRIDTQNSPFKNLSLFQQNEKFEPDLIRGYDFCVCVKIRAYFYI